MCSRKSAYATRSLLRKNLDVDSCLCVGYFCQGWSVARGFGFSAMRQTDLGAWETFGVERPLETGVGRSLPHAAGQHEAAWSQTWQIMAVSARPRMALPERYLFLNSCKTLTWQPDGAEITSSRGSDSQTGTGVMSDSVNNLKNKDLYPLNRANVLIPSRVPACHACNGFALITPYSALLWFQRCSLSKRPAAFTELFAVITRHASVHLWASCEIKSKDKYVTVSEFGNNFFSCLQTAFEGWLHQFLHIKVCLQGLWE